MYLCEPPAFGGYDGANDASIVYHEYTHGLPNRLVTDAQGSARSTPPSPARCGGLERLLRDGLPRRRRACAATTAAPELRLGGYLDSDSGTACAPADRLRAATTAPGCLCAATGPAGAGAFTYARLRARLGRPEVHDDGEIWAQTLWSICAGADRRARPAGGGRRARQYVTQAPLAARAVDPRRAQRDPRGPRRPRRRRALWTVFAERGWATSRRPTAATTSRRSPTSPSPPLTGVGTDGERTVRDEELQPVAGATVGIAGLDARPRPAAQPHATAADGTYSFDAPAVDGGGSTYPAREGAQARVPGRQRGGRRRPGRRHDGHRLHDRARLVLRRPRRDGKVASPGRNNTANGCDQRLIDDEPGVWGSATAGQRIVVDLGAPVDITRIPIDPAAGCRDDATAGLGQYASCAGVRPDRHFAPLGARRVLPRWTTARWRPASRHHGQASATWTCTRSPRRRRRQRRRVPRRRRDPRHQEPSAALGQRRDLGGTAVSGPPAATLTVIHAAREPRDEMSSTAGPRPTGRRSASDARLGTRPGPSTIHRELTGLAPGRPTTSASSPAAAGSTTPAAT